ncbi:uncharacterized protein [Magallana gigas]|uniref:uncharacterized protein n=1 Tax=Magallana gigas TaxID=29159 RepID=UPI003340BB0C
MAEDERRNEVWNELKANLNEIKKPKNVLLLGEYGTGKSSFINTVITALTGRYRYYADIGSGNLHCTTRLHKIFREEYWNPEKEEDRALNLPNFIDIIGLDVQLSNPFEVDTVNSQIMNLILNGKLSEDTDLLDLGMKLKEGKKIKEIPEDESLVIDIIVIVVSLEDDKIQHTLLDEIYKESNKRTRQFPVFAVLTKSDKCNDQKKLEKKKKDIAEEISIDVKKILICKNYHEGQNPDSRDVEILEFLTKLCDPCLKVVKLHKVEVEEEQATSTPIPPTYGCSLM